MIALILCAHLMAMHAVSECKTAQSPGDNATFRTGTSYGMLTVFGADVDAVAPAGVKAMQDAGFQATMGGRVMLATKDAPSPALTAWIELLGSGCEARSDRPVTSERIRIERANPAGVVDLARLHELGEVLQADDAEIRRSGTQYAMWTKAGFPGVCR